MSHSCFLHSSSDGHSGCFHILAIVDNAAVNIGVLMFFQISVLGSVRYIPRIEISVFNFGFFIRKNRAYTMGTRNISQRGYAYQNEVCERVLCILSVKSSSSLSFPWVVERYPVGFCSGLSFLLGRWREKVRALSPMDKPHVHIWVVNWFCH